MEISEIFKILIEKSINKKVTISGGEPLEQISDLIDLIKVLKNDEFDICLYTGWELKEVSKEIFKYIDYIKVGEFIDALKDSKLNYKGSKNQKMFKVIKGDKIWLEMI